MPQIAGLTPRRLMLLFVVSGIAAVSQTALLIQGEGGFNSVILLIAFILIALACFWPLWKHLRHQTDGRT